ncbi:hypothetical protein HYQ63_35760 [Streptomyces sp. Rer75]|nr:hypothetical protein HYQ63_35760 [Streptomyces sp. Rer75]
MLTSNPGGELGVGVTAPQVRQNQKRLPSGGESAPSRALLAAVFRQFAGEEA